MARIPSGVRFLAAALLALGVAPAASATTLTFHFSGPVAGGANPGFTANATAVFDFDPLCVGTTSAFCGLRITLRYNPTSGVPSQGEALTGLLFEPLGAADFRDGPPGNMPWAGGVVGAESLAGNANVTAANELGLVTIAGMNYVDVSSHWGLNPAISVPAGFGTHFFGSVGDILTSLNVTTSTLSSMQLFGNSPSSVEPLPPNGSRFGILDMNSLPNGGFPAGNVAYVQDEVVANILYTGSLAGVNLVQPVFGTDGNPIPEPATAVLVGLGLVALLGARRRFSR